MSKRILFFIAIFIGLQCSKMFSGTDIYSTKLQGTQISTSAILETYDDQYSAMSASGTSTAWHAANKNRVVTDYVHLKYTGALTAHFSASWSVQVILQVNSWDEFGVVLPVQNCTLSIDYNPLAGTKYKDISTFKNTSGHRVKVTVSSISYSGLTSLPADIMLENVIDVERSHNMDPAQGAVLNNSAGGTAGCTVTPAMPNVINFYWDYIEGAEEYDLEWLYKSDYDQTVGIDFSNATRITTTNQYYQINNVFDNGKIYYRVRGIAKDFASGQNRLEGVWAENTTGIVVCNIEKRNWSYNAVYGEEGKKKEVVTYFDGSTRNRQSVTLSNTENVALIAENIYDYEGRPAVQTLPAPSNTYGSNLQFYKNFNLDQAGKPYSKADFDNDAFSICGSSPVPPGMKSLSGNGASYYYSENNVQGLTNGFNAGIPDAADYPFTQTVYSNDGAVKMQSGVGPDHSIGSTHETQNYNATASQEKLDRLFGNEVGYAEHYREQVAIDPNGQISVSYQNLSGQVIATAMRGNAPSNLASLANEPYMDAEVIHENLESHFDPASESFVSLKNFMVTNYSSSYNFSYTITPQQFQVLCTSQSLACKYKLLITVKDDCGQLVSQYSPSPIPPGELINTPQSIDAADYLLHPYQLNFTINFPKNGIYRIEKQLSLDQDVLREDLAAYEAALRDPEQNDCFVSLSVTEQNYEAGVDMTECEDCQTVCEREHAAEGISPLTFPFTDENGNTYSTLHDYCRSYECYEGEPEKSCNGLLEALKDDMSPGGQYFESSLPASTPYNYHNGNYAGMNYINAIAYENSQLFETAFRNYISVNGCNPLPATAPTDWYIYLRDNWDPCYAGFMAQYHPEYCRWQRCVSLQPSDDLNGLILPYDYQQATTLPNISIPYLKIYTTPSSSTPIGLSVLDRDPYFSSVNGNSAISDNTPADYNAMKAELWQCASCAANFVGYPANTVPYTSSSSMWDWATIAPVQITVSTTDPGYNDARWENFKKLYLALKAQKDHDYGCAALPDSDYPPDNIANISLTETRFSSGVFTILSNGKAINDPDAINTLNGISSGAWANYTNYTTTPAACLYSSATVNLTWDHFLSCDAHPFAHGPITVFANIPQVPTSYPFNMTGITGPGMIQISNPIPAPPSSVTTVPQLVAYMLPQLNNAINNYHSYPYDFTSNIDLSTSSVQIIGPSALGSFGNSVTVYPSTECTSSYSFSGGAANCDPDPVFSPNCVCIQLSQILDIYNSTDENDVSIIDHTTYPTFDDYAAASLNSAYNITSVTTAKVDFWWRSCNANNENQVPMQSPLQLDADSEVSSDSRNITYAVPVEINCDPEEPCQQQGLDEADFYASEAFETQLNQYLQDFIVNYKKACFNPANLQESFKVDYSEKEYHYTLYYYDQAGNLVRTVPPKAVHRLSPSQMYAGTGNVNQVHLKRITNSTSPLFPEHSRFAQGSNAANYLVTNYKYNTLNQLVEQETSDGGKTNFWYNSIGQLRFSQNADQLDRTIPDLDFGKYSYTIYDGQGRIIEVGENSEITTITVPDPPVDGQYRSHLAPGHFSLKVNDALFPEDPGTQVTKTYYDADITSSPVTGSFLRKRVVMSSIENYEDSDDLTYNNATYYSYDVHGNVSKLTQHYPELTLSNNQFKVINYKYDLISGNVNKISYQPTKFDQYYHRYEYDANNRLTHAYTSNDDIHWQQDARYFYYLHGPLARTEIGEDKVQGLDYNYTLHGWIKAVNTNTLGAGKDVGKDGELATYMPGQTNVHKNISKDVFGYSLDYYSNDYNAINSTVTGNITGNLAGQTIYSVSSNLYNGNIKALTTAMYKPTGTIAAEMPTMSRFFKYDQLNRITEAEAFTTTLDVFSGLTAHTTATESDYYEGFQYDPNGNIKDVTRRAYGYVSGSTTITRDMDHMVYHYEDETANNKLLYAEDADDNPLVDFGDIKDQPVTNYGYSLIGNLTKDESEGITNIDWSLYGKILKIYKATENIEFRYNAAGNRIAKIIKPTVSGAEKTQEYWTSTYYVRDAQGNEMALYDHTVATDGTSVQEAFSLTETSIYGSARLGKEDQQDRAAATPHIEYDFIDYDSDGTISNVGYATTIYGVVSLNHRMGNKKYELSNHLGNVNVVISDRKISIPTVPNGTVHDYYLADLTDAEDYYAFGAPMPGRNFSSSKGYRFNFNGKEEDPETVGTGGGIQNYGFRIYNPSLGRFLSVDPLAKSYPMLTPYQFASNTPIKAVDIDGLESSWTPAGVVASFSGYNLNGDNQEQQAQTFNYNLKEAMKEPGTYKQAGLILGQIAAMTLVSILTDGIGTGTMASEMETPSCAYEPAPQVEKAAEVVIQSPSESPVKTAPAGEFKPTESLKGNEAARTVGDYMKKMEANKPIPPIEVAEINGVKYTINGHHRVEAAIRIPFKELEYKILDKQSWQAYNYFTEQDIVQAAAEARPPKLDRKVITKAKQAVVK